MWPPITYHIRKKVKKQCVIATPAHGGMSTFIKGGGGGGGACIRPSMCVCVGGGGGGSTRVVFYNDSMETT